MAGFSGIRNVEHGAEIKHVLHQGKDQIADEYKKYKRIKRPVTATKIRELGSADDIKSLASFRKAEYQKKFWKSLKDTSENLRLIQNNPSVSVNNVWVDGNELKVCQKQEINSLWHDKKMLYLDASADPDIVQRALGKKFKVSQIKTHYHERVTIKQVYDNQYTMSHLFTNYEKIFTSLNSYFEGNIPPFITSKSIEELVKKSGIINPDTKSGHYKKIKGTDDFKEDEELLVVGRYQINGDALKEKARMLYPITKEPLNFDYPSQEFIYRMENGQNQAIQQRDYIIGSDVWKLNNHLSRSETEQAVARKRLFDVEKGKKKTVYLLTSQALDITTSELFSCSTFMHTVPRNTGNEIQDVIIARLKSNGGVIKWKPKQISELTGISISCLNDAKKNEWFSNNPYWQLMTCTYEKSGKRGRKSTVTDKLIVLNGADFDEEVVRNFNTYEQIEHITFAEHCWTE